MSYQEDIIFIACYILFGVLVASFAYLYSERKRFKKEAEKATKSLKEATETMKEVNELLMHMRLKK